MARIHGTLTKWNDERGFGFITLPQGGAELFVHISAFPRDGTRPAIGELISFELDSGADGKRRAIGVQRPRRRPDPHLRVTRTGRMPAALVLVGVCIVLAYVYAPVPRQPAPIPPDAAQIAHVEPAVFHCDGRNRCTQMTSCDEAKYFLQNCPSPKMDGDHDGIPCEDQWCH